MERRKMLIVDDELMVSKSMALAFRVNYEVKTASSGIEALEVISGGFVPDIVLSDNDMIERGEGVRLVKALSLFGNLYGGEMRVALWSGNMSDETRRELSEYPVRCFKKPVSYEELAAYFSNSS